LTQHWRQVLTRSAKPDAADPADAIPPIAPAGAAKADVRPTIVPVRPGLGLDALVLDPRDPLAIARKLIADRYARDAHRLIHAWRGDLYVYTGTHYRSLESDASRTMLYEYLEGAVRRTAHGITPFQPSATTINNVLDALKAAAYLEHATVPPTWLDGPNEPNAGELIACTNGLLHFPTRELFPASPSLFTTTALPFAYESDGRAPLQWLAFLDSVWPDDPHAIEVLQEIFGYILAGDRRQQKMFMLVGPKRAGKDTIARILQRLVGPENCSGPTLSSLAGPFGLQPLIGKPLAVISDARLSGRSDQAVIAERLLSITGEGFLSIDRKHRETWNGQLPTRFVILTNELPRLEDASGALASRFIVLMLSRSWFGAEDTSLFDRLHAELPGILRWSLDGLDRLWKRGRFTVPQSSVSAVEELEDLGSPVKQFVRERCTLSEGAEIPTAALYAAWQRWCHEKGKHAGSAQTFGKQLRAAYPGVNDGSRRGAGDRFRAYVGIRLEDSEELGI
jgi:putative DNA primase/helicase